MMLLAHLWQSTVCVALVALMSALLSHAPARVRHRLWLLASVKFLVPFSLLVTVGTVASGWLPPATSASGSIAAGWLDHTLPFWSLGALELSPGASVDAVPLRSIGLILWIAGAAVTMRWRWRAWRAVSALAQTASPLDRGREAEAMRRASRAWRRDERVALLACQSNVEPGVLGVLRPQVLWPAGLSERLTDSELDAVLAHEMCHVHHRDTAVALLQVLVETLFWFYPVVWWLGARLVHERERACDEEVLRMGADKRHYAEGILKVCRFCLGAPAECRVGIGRSGLPRRIERIMEHSTPGPLAASTRAVLAAVGVLVLAAPLTAGLLAARRPAGMPDPNLRASRLAASDDAFRSRSDQEAIYRPSPEINNPKVISEAKASYTAEAMQAGIQGSVLLEAVVLRDGTVGEVAVTRSLDAVHGLDDAAVQALKRWRFEPGTKDGKPVPVRVEIEMTFTLRKSVPITDAPR